MSLAVFGNAFGVSGATSIIASGVGAGVGSIVGAGIYGAGSVGLALSISGSGCTSTTRSGAGQHAAGVRSASLRVRVRPFSVPCLYFGVPLRYFVFCMCLSFIDFRLLLRYFFLLSLASLSRFMLSVLGFLLRFLHFLGIYRAARCCWRHSRLLPQDWCGAALHSRLLPHDWVRGNNLAAWPAT